ncbi:DUF1365 domain-containing protein [Pseudonocardia sp. HH130630-07]|uniref:DUF1365 domain-containing protein n=1 Tax=Pseudonocardia sp. HH130630-07 TaxID=1690815 RepID=UPI0008152169|nr:DUF1365 domain-containing protein [Pseudonocardia sp. HH130630-07]ANY08306.1 hypothetical protein AFB00_20785 [Pseudonocardia sp. HH130630-07]
MVAAAIYEAEVRHARRRDLDTAFAHPIHLWLVDLDDLPRLPWPLRPFARFCARDHLGDPDRSIRDNVEEFLAAHHVDLAGGRVLMLAHARELGHVFNPISVFWCHRPDGSLACVIAEVHNTYGERHCYLLYPDESGRALVDKDFYVSPFLTVEGHYSMRLPEPDERLGIAVTLHQDGRPAFVATLAGRRLPATPGRVLAMLLRRPLVTLRTSALIRWHGIGLWLRRMPIVARPTRPPQNQTTQLTEHSMTDRREEGVTR